MTHPNKVVQHAIFVYCDSIGYLLRNPQEKDRAKKAFEKAEEMAQLVPSVKDWLLESKHIDNSEKYGKG